MDYVLRMAALCLLILFASGGKTQVVDVRVYSRFVSFEARMVRIFFMSNKVPLPPISAPRGRAFEVDNSIITSCPGIAFNCTLRR